jgi:serine/threonine protein kinase
MKNIGHYEVLELLGKGGFGTVYKVRNKMVGDRIEALKKFYFQPDETNIKLSFRKEVLRSRLSHPNICETYSVDETQAFITMKYVEGLSLKDLLKHSTFSWLETCYIAKKTCEALAYSHKEGVIHRDIKPGNILIDKQGHVYLADFGIASLKDELMSADSATFQVGVGTISYMAPEAFSSTTASPLMDVYATGVVMYYCVTGVQPFDQATESSNIWKIAEKIKTHVPPAPGELINIPESVNNIIITAMEKTPENRFDTAEEMRNELEIAGQSKTDWSIQKKLGQTVKKTIDIKSKSEKELQDSKTPAPPEPLPESLGQEQNVDGVGPVNADHPSVQEPQKTPSLNELTPDSSDGTGTIGGTQTIGLDPSKKPKTSSSKTRILVLSSLLVLALFFVVYHHSVQSPSETVSLDIIVNPTEIQETVVVLINGKPIEDVTLSPGKHAIHVSADDYSAIDGQIWLEKDQTNTFIAVLTPSGEESLLHDKTELIVHNMEQYESVLAEAMEKRSEIPSWMYLDLGLIHEIHYGDNETANQYYIKAEEAAETVDEINTGKERVQRTAG